MKTATKHLLLIISVIACIVVFVFVKPLPQNDSYHHFIDAQTIFGVHHFYNVISNLGFVIAGCYGLYNIIKLNMKTAYNVVLCCGFIVTGIGSAYYHYNPNNLSLVWDRLPMTIVFTTFFAQVYSWYFNKKTALQIWQFGLTAGIGSVVYWYYTETIGKGDLRLYALVQYLPMLLMVIIISLHYKKQPALLSNFIAVGICYFLAKVFESYDKQIYELTNVIGGHPLKHIAASIATFYIVGLIKKSDGTPPPENRAGMTRM